MLKFKFFLKKTKTREVRFISVKNVAFVEYDDEFQAGIAMTSYKKKN